MGKELRSDKILLDFGGDIGKKTVDQLISSHNILFDQRNELLEVMKGVLSDIHSGNYPNGEWKVDEIENLITKIEKK